jgi:16S rRNA (guanine1516-N2)-methyltransferase
MPPARPAGTVAVCCKDPSRTAEAMALAQRLNLPLSQDPADRSFPLLLTLTSARLELRQTAKGAEGPLFVDFAAEALSYRRKHTTTRKEAIARAAGLKGGATPTVLDLTAGLGRDTFILAGLGCTVQMVERSEVVGALLADGLERARREESISGIIARISLSVGDSLEILRSWQGPRPEVICLDPMYPHRRKTALVKKEMRLLRLLVGDDQDSDLLLAQARMTAAGRVVVKRPRLAPALAGPPPDFTISGKNSRFDVYLIRKAA